MMPQFHPPPSVNAVPPPKRDTPSPVTDDRHPVTETKTETRHYKIEEKPAEIESIHETHLNDTTAASFFDQGIDTKANVIDWGTTSKPNTRPVAEAFAPSAPTEVSMNWDSFVVRAA